MNVVLIGYRGSGKTTIGKRLADRLWQKFVDLDALIVRKAGKSIREIFEQDGEERFREMETDALREALQVPDTVLALGGGAIGREQNRQLLKDADCKVVYLRCEADVLLRRIQQDAGTAQNRPDLTPLGGGIEEVRMKLAEREPLYRDVMDAELDVTNMTPEDAVVYIARLM
jgi:shikimate kinase